MICWISNVWKENKKEADTEASWSEEEPGHTSVKTVTLKTMDKNLQSFSKVRRSVAVIGVESLALLQKKQT